ncbi:MAG: NusG domain II-containing protein [Clostridia bacterium]|nr:NusG domain II-containing protein [Clostridia bacterium]
MPARMKSLPLVCLLLCTLFLTAVSLADAAEATSTPLPFVSLEEADSAEAVVAPATGYILVTSPTLSGWLPLPESEDYLFPLNQTLPDGSQVENILHVTPEGVYMESSSCENQDCIHQGTVTLENRNDRILYNMIICLPNQVTLQLFTPEEVLQMYLR